MDSRKWLAENDLPERVPDPIPRTQESVLWLSPEHFQEYVSKQRKEWETFQARIPQPGSVVQVSGGYDLFDVVAGKFDRKSGKLEVTWGDGHKSSVSGWGIPTNSESAKPCGDPFVRPS